MERSAIDESTTPLDHQEPDLTGFHVPNHCIVVRPLHLEGKTKGGLLLAGKTHHDIAYLMNVCKVLKIGERAYKQEIFNESGPWCKEGDYVLIPRLGGQKIKFQGTPITMISCDKILAVLDDPNSVDPNFAISTEGGL